LASIIRTSSQLRCSQCSLGKLCLPVGLSEQDMHKLEAIIDSAHSYQAGEAIYRAGDSFKRIYAVKSGLVETVNIDVQGNAHIVGFHLPGELFGLDAIYPGEYTSTALAIHSSVVCSMDFQRLTELATQLPSIQQQLFSLMSKEVYAAQFSMSDYTAEQKIAGFILGLSNRYRQRGYAPTQFQLLMPRKDIANHLGMAPETVSRMLKRLIADGVLEINRTEIRIHNIDYLKALLGHECRGSALAHSF